MASKILMADEDILHSAKLGFYGAIPVAARPVTASFHRASWVSVSSNITVGSALAAWAAEVTNTLVGLGIWT